MKKNLIYIVTPVVLLVLGIAYRYFYLADTINETANITSENKILSEKYNRDTFVQNHIDQTKSLYEFNKRGNKSYGELIVELLGVVEKMLKDTGIQYEADKINQDTSEQTDYKAGTATFAISLSFETRLENISSLINKIETSEHVINVAYIRINRSRISPQKSAGGGAETAEEFDEYNVKAKVFCEMKLQFVKYL